jgi:hypothetical protein
MQVDEGEMERMATVNKFGAVMQEKSKKCITLMTLLYPGTPVNENIASCFMFISLDSLNMLVEKLTSFRKESDNASKH